MFSDALAARASDCPGSHNVSFQSGFLALPAEVRNAICAYALSATSPLLYRPSSQPNTRGTSNEAGQTGQFNQLKHVNRQLRAETEDLEIQHSEVTFGHILYAKVLPDDQQPEMSSFVNLLPPWKLQWLTTVILKPSKLSFSIIWNFQEMFKAWEKCATHFQEHPQISVKYILPSLSSVHGGYEADDVKPGHFIKVGIILAKFVRGIDLSYLRNGIFVSERYHCFLKRRMRDWDARELEKRLPNFRIFPYQEELSALWICKALNDMPRVSQPANLLQHRILVATEWIERGI